MRNPTLSSRITSNPEVLGGKPIVRGTRIAVALIVDWIAAGQTSAQIVDDYPVLTPEDVEAALLYSASERERTEIRSWSA